MSKYVRKNSKGRYYTAGTQYSVETYTSIFKIALEYRNEVGVFPHPYRLSEMACVSFKVAKKAILFISGENEHLHRPSGHGYSGRGSMKLSMTDQFFFTRFVH